MSLAKLRIRVTDEGKPLTDLDIEDSIIVGRSQKCDLRLERSWLSGQHACVSLREGGPVVTDLGSLNGTFVNGTKIPSNAEFKLEDGDRIELASYHLTVEYSPPPPPEPQPSELGSTVLAPVASEVESEDATVRFGHGQGADLVAAAKFQHFAPRLVIAGMDGRRIEPMAGSDCVVGRGDDCDVVIKHDSISRHHAKISYIDGRFFVSDTKSANGTFVDENPITVATGLRGDQCVRFGTVPALFVINPPEGDKAQEERGMNTLVDHVVKKGFITQGQARQVLTEQGPSGMRLGEYLVERGLMKPGDWSKIAAQADVIKMLEKGEGRGRSPVLVVLLIVVALFVAWFVLDQLGIVEF